MSGIAGKTMFISGASRGIGLAIALRAARDGANVAVVAKTTEKHAKLEGTIHESAAQIEKAGGKALALACDIRDDAQIAEAVAKTIETFGGIDICVNNASAISLTSLDKTEPKRFDLMHGVNTRGTFMVSKACLPHLRKSTNPHILMMSPPLDMNPRWFGGHVAYSVAKYGMSLCALGMAEELKADGIAVNALWPRSIIATAAIQFGIGNERLMKMARTPDILADAAHLIFCQDAKSFSGNFLIDDTFLSKVGGITDFDQYRTDPSAPLAPDFFVPENSVPPPGVTLLPLSALGG